MIVNSLRGMGQEEFEFEEECRGEKRTPSPLRGGPGRGYEEFEFEEECRGEKPTPSPPRGGPGRGQEEFEEEFGGKNNLELGASEEISPPHSSSKLQTVFVTPAGFKPTTFRTGI